MSGSDVRRALITGLAQIDLPLAAADVDALMQYVALLQRWNKRINLIGATDDLDVIHRHVLDSLSVHRFIRGPRLADIGTGAGFPGLPLAISDRALQVTLLDSRRRRCEFVQHVVHALRLENAQVVCSRVENYRPTEKFDTLIARALTTLEGFVLSTRHLLDDDGQWLAMKGQYPREELSALTDNESDSDSDRDSRKAVHTEDTTGKEATAKSVIREHMPALAVEVASLRVPKLNAARHVVRITNR